MKPVLKNFAVAGLLSAALVGGMLSTTTPVQATHQIGHAILGGIIGGVIGGAIVNQNRNYYDDRRPTDYGVPVYQPRYQPRCYWQKQYYYDSYGIRRVNRVQVCS